MCVHVPFCVYLHVTSEFMCAYEYIIGTYMGMSAYVYSYKCEYICVLVSMCVPMYTYEYACVCLCMFMLVEMYVCACECVYLPCKCAVNGREG